MTIWASADEHRRYCQPVDPKSRRRCPCCNRRATHLGMANGVSLSYGCELAMRRWARNPVDHYRSLSKRLGVVLASERKP